jgi:hypothetical protein
LILDFEFDQHLESHKHVINIIMGFRDMGCYIVAANSDSHGVAGGERIELYLPIISTIPTKKKRIARDPRWRK